MQLGSPLYRLLGDDARLRILRLLAAERLNVSELTGILGLAQSGVSRHLGMLKEAGLIAEQREGVYTWYRLSPRLQDADNGFGPLWPLLQAQFEATGQGPDGRADDARLEEVRRLRKENFDQHSGPDARERQLVPGRSWAAWARALGHLLPPLRVADLGCGDGYLTIEASRWASRVIADRPLAAGAREGPGARQTPRRAQHHLAAGRDRACAAPRRLRRRRHPFTGAAPRAQTPATRLSEAARIVSPGGHVLVLDLREHDQEWVTERLGDRWHGFSEEALEKLLAGAGLKDVKVSVGARRPGDPFTVLIASGRKPAEKSQKTK